MRSDILQFLPILLISCRTDPRRSATSQPSWAVAGFSPISNGVLRPPLRRRRGPPPRRRNAAADDGTVEYAAREAETSGVGRNVYVSVAGLSEIVNVFRRIALSRGARRSSPNGVGGGETPSERNSHPRLTIEFPHAARPPARPRFPQSLDASREKDLGRIRLRAAEQKQ